MKNVAELIKIKEETLKNMKSYKYNIRVCGGTGCTSSGSMKIIDELEAQLEKAGIRDDVNIVQTGCFGLCALGPIMIFPSRTRAYRGDCERAPRRRKAGA